MRYLGFILVLLTVLSSCDSREDWFAREDDGATFIIKSSKSAWMEFDKKYEFRNDTIYSDNNRVVELNVKINKIEWDDDRYNPGFLYSSESLYLDIEGFGQKISRSRHSDRNVTTDRIEPHLTSHDEGSWFVFMNALGGSAPTTSNDTSKAPVLNTAHVILELENAFQNKIYCHVKINCLGDIVPHPVMEIKDVDGSPMEKVLDLSKSYDKDGSVVKYEYCIDGEIVEYSLPTFDCDPAGVPAGKGAYGGTYITSTEFSEVRHSFQTEGEHIVYYRCMDNLGLWSVWNNVLITINK